MQEEVLLFFIEGILLIVYVFYLVWDYSAKEVPFYIKALTYFSWILTFSIVLVLPIDILQQRNIQQQQNTLENTEKTQLQQGLFLTWRILYWSNFLLSWFILPFFQDYEDSGDFFWRERMKYSIKKNLLIYTVGLILGIIIIILLALNSDSSDYITNSLIGLANFFGLFLVVLLLGFGLVAIPKRYLKESKEEEVLDKCYKDSVYLEEQRTEKGYDIEEICKTLIILEDSYTHSEFQVYISKIIALIPPVYFDQIKQQNIYRKKELPSEYQNLNLKQLGSLHKSVKQIVFDLRRINTKFDILLNKVKKLERQYEIDSIENQNLFIKIVIKAQYIWVNYFRRYYNKYIGYVFTLLSVILMFGEFQVLMKQKIDINILSSVILSISDTTFTNIILLVLLTYMMFCVYYGLFSMKISGLISFNNKHNTDAPSLMFGSVNFGRVSFPLCYNFLQMTAQLDKSNQFFNFFKRLDEFSVFDSTFTIILPLMLIIMSLCNFFNIGDRVMQAIGLGQFAFQESPQVLSSLGKEILLKEKQRKNSKSTSNESSQKSSLLELSKYTSPKYIETQDRVKVNQIRNFDEILNI
ncbi:unnamed protein product [Paramecium primaurelia]|uniref:LMBR1-like motif protein n=1 Tax=Paramecium primaurelia TaxID=5886 RepID=A0A8S1K4Q5_PARPR|nr:unnamed protein product [Paramecium primaurelia]